MSRNKIPLVGKSGNSIIFSLRFTQARQEVDVKSISNYSNYFTSNVVSATTDASSIFIV